ncbi:MAG: hypothetical protein R2750_13730 [Bacteroidales bacterium]
MKQLIIFLLTLLFMVSCSEPKLFESIESTHEDGTPKIVKFYKDESKETLVKETRYWENGHKSMEGTYKNGNRDGKWTAWYIDGTIWSSGEYTDGIENGLKVVYHNTGQKYYEGEIKDDKRIGTWKFWDKDGAFVKEIDYNKK